MDIRAWWAAIYGVTQSRTRLRRLSSSKAQYIAELKDIFNGFQCLLLLVVKYLQYFHLSLPFVIHGI